MAKGSVWEVRSLRVMLSLIFLIMSYMILNNFLNDRFQTSLEKLLVFIFPSIFLIYCVSTFFRLNQKNYPLYLLIIIVTSHLSLNGVFIGAEWSNLQLSPEERLGVGRAMDFSFNSFPPTAIIALFFQRLWAVFLWLILSLITVLKNVFLILLHPLTYFTSDWPLLLQDGYAISSWMLQDNIMISAFFIVLLLGVALFNRYVLSATLNFERANAALGRYF